jgi:hypothetical protein
MFSVLLALAVLSTAGLRAHAQAALLMEEPYGFFGALNPTGHNAVYFQNICADTPTHLRRCDSGEMGSVIARYQGIDGYDWVAIPLLPYLYSVDDPSAVPERVDRETVDRLRSLYRERHIESLGANLQPGNIVHGGWTQLVGVAYERRIYALRFSTTPAQDDALIERLNSNPNRTRFNLLYSNCADFARVILNADFPGAFPRSIFPDAGMTTPKQLAWKLERYARKHPDTRLTICEIPQIPGYRRLSRSNKGVAESLITTAYAVPIAIANPYLAGGLFVDYLVRSRYHLVPRSVQVLSPSDLSRLTVLAVAPQNAASAGVQAPRSAVLSASEMPAAETVNLGLKEMKDSHE